MIVDVVNVECFAVFESKNQSPVPTYRHRPESGESACQRMKSKTWERHILNRHGGIQDAKDQPESLFWLRPDAGVASSCEKLAQSLMGKAANHKEQL